MINDITHSKVVSCSIAVLLAINSFSQNTNLCRYNADISPSVEPFKMGRFGNNVPSLNTGAMIFSIPVFEYKDPDFDIPLSIDYSYDGFKPSVDSGTIGLGWFINCGGVITREVRGVPDDQIGKIEPEGSIPQTGYYYTHKLLVPGESSPFTSDKAIVYEIPYDDFNTRRSINCPMLEMGLFRYYNPSPVQSYNLDTQPDIFHFNFMGIHGEFILAMGDTVRIFNANIPEGELSVNFVRPNPDNLELPKIIISSGDGYEYQFGGSMETLDREFNIADKGQLSYREKDLSITAWRLNKIIAPNGRTVTFNYKERKQGSLKACPYETPKLIEVPDYGGSYNPSSGLNYLANFTNVLSDVAVDDTTVINFIYAAKEHIERLSARTLDCPYNLDPDIITEQPLCLQNIVVNSKDGIIIDTIGLSQSYSSDDGGSVKMFLKHLRSTSKGYYAFSYLNDVEVFPYNDTYALDHWGFWNGKFNSVSCFNPAKSDYKTADDVFDIENYRDPDYVYGKYGSLCSITYPTGGTTTIEYEGNQAGKVLIRNLTHFPHEISRDMPVGGIRVKNIKDYDADMSLISSRNYSYVSLYGQTTSSGTLMHMPRYEMFYNYQRDVLVYPPSITRFNYYFYSFFGDAEIGINNNDIISYSKVIETSSDNSRKEYIFSGYETDPDNYSITDTAYNYLECSKGHLFNDAPISATRRDSLRMLFLPPLGDFSRSRGKLVKTKYYDNLGSVKRITTNNYANILGAEQRIVSNLLPDFACYDWKVYYPRVASIVDSTFDNGWLVSRKSYTYNSKGQASSMSFTDMTGNYGEKTYLKYCHESEPGQYHSFLRAALYGKVRTKLVGGDEYLISTERYGYDSIHSNINPTRIIDYPIGMPILKTSSGTDVFSLGVSGGCRTSTYTYDGKFRLVRVSLPGGRYIAYSWDSDGSHIVKKEVNATDNTYNYSWKDLVGITGITYPTLQSSSYLYDSKNRLSIEKDSKGKLIYKYEYKLNNE